MAEPYEGTGAGAYFAGQHTLSESQLDPETEAKLRRHYAEAIALLANTTTKMKTEVIESHSNLGVAYAQGLARTLGAIAQMSQASAAGQAAAAQMMSAVSPVMGRFLQVTGGTIDTKLDNKIQGARQQLGTQLVNTANNTLVDQIKGQRPEEAAATIMESYSNTIANGYRNVLTPHINSAVQKGTKGDVYRIKASARAPADAIASEAFDRLMNQIDPAVAKELRANKDMITVGSVTKGLTAGGDVNFTWTNEDAAFAAEELRVMAPEIERAWEKAMSAGVGMPVELVKEAMSSLDMMKEVVEAGPEEYAKKVGKMPEPLEVQKAKQILMEGLRSLDPRDPLVEAVEGYAAVVPHFYKWAGAMGFTDATAAVNYAVDHPDEIIRFVQISRENPEIVNISDTEVPHELAGRLRQEGIYQTKGPFKTKFLSKKIERILGFGIVPTGGYQSFPGDTSEEKLDQAIAYADAGLDVYDDKLALAEGRKGRKEAKESAREALAGAIRGDEAAPRDAQDPDTYYLKDPENPSDLYEVTPDLSGGISIRAAYSPDFAPEGMDLKESQQEAVRKRLGITTAEDAESSPHRLADDEDIGEPELTFDAPPGGPQAEITSPEAQAFIEEAAIVGDKPATSQKELRRLRREAERAKRRMGFDVEEGRSPSVSTQFGSRLEEGRAGRLPGSGKRPTPVALPEPPKAPPPKVVVPKVAKGAGKVGKGEPEDEPEEVPATPPVDYDEAFPESAVDVDEPGAELIVSNPESRPGILRKGVDAVADAMAAKQEKRRKELAAAGLVEEFPESLVDEGPPTEGTIGTGLASRARR